MTLRRKRRKPYQESWLRRKHSQAQAYRRSMHAYERMFALAAYNPDRVWDERDRHAYLNRIHEARIRACREFYGH